MAAASAAIAHHHASAKLVPRSFFIRATRSRSSPPVLQHRAVSIFSRRTPPRAHHCRTTTPPSSCEHRRPATKTSDHREPPAPAPASARTSSVTTSHGRASSLHQCAPDRKRRYTAPAISIFSLPTSPPFLHSSSPLPQHAAAAEKIHHLHLAPLPRTCTAKHFARKEDLAGKRQQLPSLHLGSQSVRETLILEREYSAPRVSI